MNFQRCPGKDKVPLAELKSLLEDVGLDLPNFQIREILNMLRHDNRDEFVTKAQFVKVRISIFLTVIFRNCLKAVRLSDC